MLDHVELHTLESLLPRWHRQSRHEPLWIPEWRQYCCGSPSIWHRMPLSHSGCYQCWKGRKGLGDGVVVAVDGWLGEAEETPWFWHCVSSWNQVSYRSAPRCLPSWRRTGGRGIKRLVRVDEDDHFAFRLILRRWGRVSEIGYCAINFPVCLSLTGNELGIGKKTERKREKKRFCRASL